ncbi:two component transcriptional regulator, LuxR family [Variovorax sp. HW608]|uniref:response regulator n=1 Tax=Variovorax sp. HW608 TaxID=1034889 RepID=UPI00081F7DAE|nr:response regulator transcription factor [Variovorax sp. HW608]SCK08671.1 two component transcriptional regulator, LuxR family [Variovorax sp. HW608]
MEDILIVDDDHAVRARLARVAAAAAPRARCAMAGSLAEARERLASAKYDLALLDVGLPDGSGLELLPWMQAHAPEVDVVVVSSLGDDATVLQAIRSGAVGYLLKNGSDTELELSLCSMQRGGAPIDPVIARRILKLVAAPQPASPALVTIAQAPVPAATAELSEREMDVLRLVAQGHSNREIARSLTLSINTVECHAKNIYRKLAVRSRAGAVYSARTQGLLP